MFQTDYAAQKIAEQRMRDDIRDANLHRLAAGARRDVRAARERVRRPGFVATLVAHLCSALGRRLIHISETIGRSESTDHAHAA